MELPTYTNIWKIEKRLYKLYDFRLPMPVPVGQVAAFLAIAVPYMLILALVGMPFSHTWVWLYVLPPGLLAWLVTRPVLEGKRLPELVLSQLRYLTEPRTWCRLAPLAEKDEILVVARVWRVPATTAAQVDPPADAPASAAAVTRRPAGDSASRAAVPRTDGPATAATGAATAPAATAPAATAPAATAPAATAAAGAVAGAGHRVASEPAREAARPAVTVRVSAAGGQPLRSVERALRASPGGWPRQVVLVPGGHRPGKPDHVQRDRARARRPLAGPARIVLLGCTAGAGQTVTTLLTGQLLASLRGQAVAVLDFSGRPGSLTELAHQVPRLLPSAVGAGQDGPLQERPGPARGLQVVTADHAGAGPRDAGVLIDAVAARYSLTLADPAAEDVPRALPVADQLVLVAPAGSNAAGSLAMTLEWLEAHGHARLAQAAVTVLNGVSARTAEHVERAAGVAAGRCRAIVQVPWDARLPAVRALASETVQAYTALAGVLMSGLADPVDTASAAAGSVTR